MYTLKKNTILFFTENIIIADYTLEGGSNWLIRYSLRPRHTHTKHRHTDTDTDANTDTDTDTDTDTNREPLSMWVVTVAAHVWRTREAWC